MSMITRYELNNKLYKLAPNGIIEYTIMQLNPENSSAQPERRNQKTRTQKRWWKDSWGKWHFTEVPVLRPGEVPESPPDDPSLTKEKTKPKKTKPESKDNWTTWIAESEPGKNK